MKFIKHSTDLSILSAMIVTRLNESAIPTAHGILRQGKDNRR